MLNKFAICNRISIRMEKKWILVQDFKVLRFPESMSVKKKPMLLARWFLRIFCQFTLFCAVFWRSVLYFCLFSEKNKNCLKPNCLKKDYLKILKNHAKNLAGCLQTVNFAQESLFFLQNQLASAIFCLNF